MSKASTSLISADVEDDPEDRFEIEDYYIASDLEGLIMVFENLLQQWKPLIEDRTGRRTIITREQISVEVEIIVPGAPEADPDHPIALLNLPIHISLIPHITFSVGNEARYVLSAACMAAFATGIDIPFVAACDDSLWIGRSLSYRYQVEAMDWNIPERLTNLSGILSVFYELCERWPPDHPPMVSVEYAYNSQQFDVDLAVVRNRPDPSVSDFTLKWGCSPKHRLLMRLVVRWTPFPEGTFTSNSFFTELEPQTAPVWQLSCQLAPGAKFRLSSTLRRFLTTCAALSDFASLDDIARRDHSLFPSYDIQERARACFLNDDSVPSNIIARRPTKSCPFGSLLSNLVVCMMQQSSHEPYRIAQLYFAFVSELRRHWDEGRPLSGLKRDEKATFPDLHCCLLYQKLQVLDHCIRLRSQGGDGGPQLFSPVIERAKRWADFDYDDLHDDLDSEPDQISTVSAEESHSADTSPEGINYDITLSDVYLLDGKTNMHVPITLESRLLTEDEIEEQHEIMAGLGTDNDSTAVRAELQSSSLLSDMSAFKAANPGAELGDFVRWYSPNDWIAGKGLSKRMAGGDNLWKRCWARAIPCPASRQQPLFDCVAQGERILDYFKTISPSLLMNQFSAIAISCSASLIATTLSTSCTLPSTTTVADLALQKSDPSSALQQIEKAEEVAELVSRLSGSVLKLTEIESIITSGAAVIESDRERLLTLIRERSRSLAFPDHRLYIASAQCARNNLQVAVQLDGGSLVTVSDRFGPSQVIFCSILPS